MKPLLILAALTLATPLHAAGFQAPEGCTATLTVQARGCRVSNHYTCTADQPGDQWRADYDQEGVFFLSRINHATEWVESFSFDPKTRQTLDANPADPADFSGLLSSGRDDFDFWLSRDDGTRSHVTGFDALTGKTITIDGVELKQTEYSYTETDPDGNILGQARGHEYVHPEWRNFFAGPSEHWDGEAWLPMDGSPRQFILPGESGFGATQPIFDCGALMSQAPANPLIQQVKHER